METTDLLQKIADSVKTIAHDEVELVGTELAKVAKTAATEAAVMLFGGVVALIGVGMLCVAVVIALEPVIPSLAVRLVLMAVIHAVIGVVLAGTVALRLRRDVVPDLSIVGHEAKAAAEGVKQAIDPEEKPAHA